MYKMFICIWVYTHYLYTYTHMYVYIYTYLHVSKRQIYCSTYVVLLLFGVSEVAQSVITDRGRSQFVHGIKFHIKFYLLLI